MGEIMNSQNLFISGSRDSAVGIVSDLVSSVYEGRGWNRGSIPERGKRFQRVECSLSSAVKQWPGYELEWGYGLPPVPRMSSCCVHGKLHPYRFVSVSLEAAIKVVLCFITRKVNIAWIFTSSRDSRADRQREVRNKQPSNLSLK